MLQPTILIEYNPGEDGVIGVFGNLVHIRVVGYLQIENDLQEFDCIAKVEREEYSRIISEWLDQMRDFCETYNEYFDASGSLIAKDYYEDDPVMVNWWNPESGQMEPQEKPCYYVVSFEPVTLEDEEDE